MWFSWLTFHHLLFSLRFEASCSAALEGFAPNTSVFVFFQFFEFFSFVNLLIFYTLAKHIFVVILIVAPLKFKINRFICCYFLLFNLLIYLFALESFLFLIFVVLHQYWWILGLLAWCFLLVSKLGFWFFLFRWILLGHSAIVF